MIRREFITLLGGAAAWPLAARAAERPATYRVIGFLDPRSPGTIEGLLQLAASYVEGENVSIIYRRGEGQFGGIPSCAELADKSP